MNEMFTRFYNMGSNPFTKGIAAADAHVTEDIRQIHARLDHLCRTGGIGLITADPGMGKTFAVRSWVAKTNPNTTKAVYLCLSTVTNIDFYRLMSTELGLEPSFKKAEMYKDIQNCIRSLAEERHVKVVVVIDEAHLLHSSILRDLQMLTNFDMDSKDMFALVLVGHSALAQYLNRQPYESLRQRLVVSYRMGGLDEKATGDYIRSMLLKVGADPDIFDEAAIASAYSISGGSIRRLNAVLCNALTIGAQNNLRAIDTEVVRSAAEELSLT